MSLGKTDSNKVAAVGPFGGDGGSPWNDGCLKGVKQIIIVHAEAIDSIRFQYAKTYSSVWSDKHGGNGGHKTDTIVLNFPDEKIVSITGRYGKINSGKPVIRSLTFHTNWRTFGPYGVEQGTYFSIPINDGAKIAGFHGRSGWFLDAIGVNLVQSTTTWQQLKEGCASYIQKISN
eukprot:TRINITY_DN9859_c0_g1_i2.p1 TRINITY_DN9859_c0_g1~~TRINITY_DN9859_c0_g1_i2.p1  ORF type:complete len:175 (+),score=18.81 TRINITY_DN9859_c0_g1_i2:72-596(+)